jgi:hypothetical protein
MSDDYAPTVNQKRFRHHPDDVMGSQLSPPSSTEDGRDELGPRGDPTKNPRWLFE